MKTRRAIVRAVSAGAAFLSVFLVAPVQAVTPKPDLVVTSVRLDPDWVFRGEHVNVTWLDRVANIGTAAAARSYTGSPRILAEHRVPLLDVGGTSRQGQTYAYDFPSASWDYGKQQVRFCADSRSGIAESDETNNCKVTPLTVVPYSWSGTFTGTESFFGLDGVAESWQGTITFTWFAYAPRSKAFVFIPTAASIEYTVAGTDQFGRVFSGSGTTGWTQPIADDPCQLRVYFATKPNSYATSDCEVPSGFSFPVTYKQAGQTLTWPQSAPSQPTYAAFGSFLLPGITDQLENDYSNGVTAWSWNLAAGDPSP